MTPRLLVALTFPLLLAAGLGMGGCSALAPTPAVPDSSAAEAFPRPADGEFSVMTFNLHQYALQEAAAGSEGSAPKPRPGTDALVEAIRRAAPDVLALQEMGDSAAWTEFKFRLREAGLEYRYEEYLPRDGQSFHLALLSRLPIVARQPHTDDLYTIGPTQFPVQHGFLDVTLEIHPDYHLRLLAADLKSKVFHEYGQAEMRRNEARLLCNHIRAVLDENPAANLLVVGDFGDTPDSRPLREILTYQDKPILFDLRPTDPLGDAWTQRQTDDTHQRVDYMLVNSGLLHETVAAKLYVVRTPGLVAASDHCPLVAIFSAREQGPESAPDLSLRKPADFPQHD